MNKSASIQHNSYQFILNSICPLCTISLHTTQPIQFVSKLTLKLNTKLKTGSKYRRHVKPQNIEMHAFKCRICSAKVLYGYAGAEDESGDACW